ncbi:hypothetical protein [Arthrobacter sp. KNU40]|uniref:hypothetical protein n=1 Tax=Arthrobacter sp. KNU40 TaxID=3447965 RepID=UPI003F636E75
MIIPSAPCTARVHFEAAYESVFATLVSCLPGLLHAELECQWLDGEEIARGSCTLSFPGEEEKQFALSSMEWIELIDETTDVLDWESVEIQSTDDDAKISRSELIAS